MSMQESRRILQTILEAPYERRRWQNEGERTDLEKGLDMKLIWSLLKIVAQHAQEVRKAGALSAEDETFIKVGRVAIN